MCELHPEYLRQKQKQEELLRLLKEVQSECGDTDPDEKEKVLFKGDRRFQKRS